MQLLWMIYEWFIPQWVDRRDSSNPCRDNRAYVTDVRIRRTNVRKWLLHVFDWFNLPPRGIWCTSEISDQYSLRGRSQPSILSPITYEEGIPRLPATDSWRASTFRSRWNLSPVLWKGKRITSLYYDNTSVSNQRYKWDEEREDRLRGFRATPLSSLIPWEEDTEASYPGTITGNCLLLTWGN